MASGMPSRRLQISATAPAFAASTTNSGTAACARSTNSRTAALVATSSTDAVLGIRSERSGQTCSPSTARPSRLVARMRTLRHSCSTASANSPASSSRCSQLSSTSRSCLARRNSTMLPLRDTLGWGCTPSVAATTCTSASGSLAAASSHSHAPSGKRGSISAATWVARRVLPTPPTPIRVTSRASSRAFATRSSSSSRPMNDVSWSGRLPA